VNGACATKEECENIETIAAFIGVGIVIAILVSIALGIYKVVKKFRKRMAKSHSHCYEPLNPVYAEVPPYNP
jgi:hypothetical protein